MRHLLIILPIVSLAASSVTAQQEPGQVGYPSVKAALDALKRDPSAAMQEQSGWTIVSNREGTDPVLWSFTPSTHPAYPAVVKRTVLQDRGQVSVHMAVLCEAAKPACDELVADFKALNDGLRADIQRRAARPPDAGEGGRR